MNFFNPYYYTMPTNYLQPKIGLLGGLFGSTGVTISNFLNGTQRVLNIANQTIPLVKQVKPMIGNAKTMFRVMNEFKKVEKPTIVNDNVENISNIENVDTYKKTNNIQNESGPTFFI